MYYEAYDIVCDINCLVKYAKYMFNDFLTTKF